MAGRLVRIGRVDDLLQVDLFLRAGCGRGTALGAVLGALIIQMISSGIVILGIDQNYSQIIIGAVVIAAVVLDNISTWLARRRLTARPG